MKQSKRYELDKRTANDIKNQIDAMAKAYVPEWHFDTENPDIGSVIGFVFADQMADNIKRYNELLEVYHGDLVNMMGISLMPAQSSGTSVTMNLVSDTIPGTYVPKGTKLLGGVAENNIIFETSHPLYVTNSQLKQVFMTAEATGKIIPIFGNLEKKPLVEDVSDEEEGEKYEEEESNQVPSFKLFDFNGEGIERNAILFYHTDCFDIEEERIFMRLKGEDDLVSKIMRGDFRVTYLTESGFVPVDEIIAKGDILIIRKSEECRKVERDREYSVMAIEAVNPIEEKIRLSAVDFSSIGEKQPIKFAGNGNTDYDPRDFKPFGETLSLFEECYLTHDEYFGRVGARVTMTFALEFGTHLVTMAQALVEDELKIIKRKPKAVYTETIVDSYIQEISVEYLSATGWRRLETSENISNIFSEAKEGRVSFSFVCPPDWVDMGGQGRTLRFQILKSDNCYMMPCAHHYPIIKNVEVSYSYDGKYLKPDMVEAVYGTDRKNLTKELLSGRGITAFSRSKYTDNALYLGFNRKMEAGPVSILFEMEDEITFIGEKLRFEYSTIDGFKPLDVVDKTETFARTGQVRFMPPEDFAAVTIEEMRCYWIRVVDVEKRFSNEKIYRPIIKKIYTNAVDVFNIDTHEMESFYMDAVSPNMSVMLAADNILDVDVWVNENGLHKEEEMRELVREDPCNVMADYDFQGNIKDFFTRWTEVQNFDNSHKGDRHYVLDRLGRRVIFGDGVHVEIPRVTGSVAIKVIARSCIGADANVDVGVITDALSAIPFIGEMQNPFAAYGGSNTESIENAMTRAAGVLGNKRRLVTERDYINEVLTGSDNVDKAACIIGESESGRKDEGLISLVLLMKDYGMGTHSFDRLLPSLKKHLDECVEMTAKGESIEIVEPIGVAVSVDIWLNKMDDENDYEIHQKLIKALEEYLSPVSSGMHQGWPIGKMPSETQIMMKLNSLKTGAFIRRLVITAKYTDTKGTHECDLKNLPKNRFFVVKSGKHKAHIINDELMH